MKETTKKPNKKVKNEIVVNPPLEEASLADTKNRKLYHRLFNKNGKVNADRRFKMNRSVKEEHGAGFEGTNKLTKKYKKDTPGQHKDINEAFVKLIIGE